MYWLAKTEPGTYSIDQLVKEKKTNWNNIRNYQARNFLRQIKKGDQILIYHSGDDKAVVGLAEVIKEAYPDIDPEGGDWSQVDLKAIEKFAKPLPLKEIKSTPELKDLPLIKQSRLSFMPVTRAQFDAILELTASKKAQK